MPYLQVKPIAVGESEANKGFTVTLNAASATEVRVDYDLLDGSASGTNTAPDFVRKTGTLIFAPGETSKFVPVSLVNDPIGEPPELFWLSLSNAVNATVQQKLTPALIFDNDLVAGKPTVQVTNDPVFDEKAGTATFFVWLDRPSAKAVDLTWLASPGTADASDFRVSNGTLSFAPGETVKTVSINLLDDSVAEGDEYFQFILGTGPNTDATIGNISTYPVIAANDAAPVASPYISAEAMGTDEPQPLAGFTVRLSAPSTSEVRVNFDLLDGSARSTANVGSVPAFQRNSGTLVFAPGETSHFVPVAMFDDVLPENSAMFWLELSNPVNGTITQRLTPGLVIDNDATTGVPGAWVGDAIVDELAGFATFYVRLDRPSTSAVTLSYTTQADTAEAGKDFTAISGLAQFAAGETLATVRVPLLADKLAEPDESFTLVLSGPINAQLTDPVGRALIVANGNPAVATPVISMRPITVGETDVMASVTVQLSAPSTREVRVDYDMSNGSATFSSATPDFLRHIGTLVFAPGQTVKTIVIPLVNDAIGENPENFTVSLLSPVNATLAQDSVIVTILDDDLTNAPLLSYGGGNDVYTVTSGKERIAESPRGGLDLVKAAQSYTLPDNVEILYLSGAASNGVGNSGDNMFRGTPGANTFDGRDGIDTMIFIGPRANYSFTNVGATGRDVASSAEGRDRLNSIERFQFTDTISAEDTRPGGHTYEAYAMWNAAFNKAPTTQELSRWTAALDRLEGSTRDLAQMMINFYAPGVADAAFVSYLWGTIVGGAIPADQLAFYTGQLASGAQTQASLLDLVWPLDLNTVEIAGIVGKPIALDPVFFPVPA